MNRYEIVHVGERDADERTDVYKAHTAADAMTMCEVEIRGCYPKRHVRRIACLPDEVTP